MGVVTRTLSLAFWDLAMLALLLIILFLYATMGTIVFLLKIEQFSTYIRSLRTVFTWSVLGDDVGVGDEPGAVTTWATWRSSASCTT